MAGLIRTTYPLFHDQNEVELAYWSKITLHFYKAQNKNVDLLELPLLGTGGLLAGFLKMKGREDNTWFIV